ncbi:MAG TPA: hypothetical protein DFS52_15815, partial [Myxococcales bacterium]|nr:hypothetical protein [Myxococcales bacterium]
CATNPCQNGGPCAPVDGEAVCTCVNHFAGDLCEGCEEGYSLVENACVYSVPTVNIEWCNVQHPASYSKATGEAETIYGQVYSTSGDGTAAAGQLAGVSAKLCYSATQVSASSDVAAMTCIDAAFNPAASGNNDEYQADLVFDTAGTYYYLYAMSGDAGTSWTLCETTDGSGNNTGAGVATITAAVTDPSAQIAAVRATADGTGLALPIDNAVVTYLKPQGGSSDPAGFFVQGAQAGPAIFVAVDPATLNPQVAVGDVVSFDVTEVATANGLKQVAALVNFGRASTSYDVTTLVQNVDLADNLVTALDSYESEAIAFTATISSSFSFGGSGHQSAQIQTDTLTPSSALKLRLPDSVVNGYNLVQGCMVELDYGVMWRYNANAQPSAYDIGDFAAIVCPAPAVVGVAASSATEVVVTFDRNIDPASVLSDFSQFAIAESGAGGADLAISAAVVSGKTITLTTAAQTEGVSYDIIVIETITDTLGEPLAAAWNGEFTGFAPVVGSPVVISQLYPGGGTSSGALKYDFIELRNLTGSPIDLSSWSLQYASATGGFTTNKVNLSGSIPANGYFLVRTGGAGTGGVDLPVTADQTTSSLAMGGTAGKVALVSNQTAIGTDYTSADVLDFVGYGSTANHYEGSAPATGHSASDALFRANGGCTDTNDNAADFSGAPAAPRNSATAVSACQ